MKAKRERGSNQHFPESQLLEDRALFSEKIASTRATYKLRYHPPYLSTPPPIPPPIFVPRSLIFLVITTKNDRRTSPVCAELSTTGMMLSVNRLFPSRERRSIYIIALSIPKEIPFLHDHPPICRLSCSCCEARDGCACFFKARYTYAFFLFLLGHRLLEIKGLGGEDIFILTT